MTEFGRDPTGTPALPVTWRPRLGRLVPHGLAVAVVVVTIALAVAVPGEYRVGDRVGFVVVGVLVAGGLYLLGRCRLRADGDGLTVVNVLRTTRLGWAEVLGASLNVGDAWAVLDLDDGSSMSAMGIQASDGDRAQRAVVQLRALIHERGEAPDPR